MFNTQVLLIVPEQGEIVDIRSTGKVITVPKGETVIADYIEIPDPPNPSMFEITAFFGTIS